MLCSSTGHCERQSITAERLAVSCKEHAWFNRQGSVLKSQGCTVLPSANSQPGSFRIRSEGEQTLG